MSEHSQKKELKNALKALPVILPLHVAMAWMIYRCTGIERALNFVNGLEGAGLLPGDSKGSDKETYQQLRLL